MLSLCKQVYCFIFPAEVVFSSKQQQTNNVNRDKLVKVKEWGHCLYLIPVKAAQDTTSSFFGTDKQYGGLCMNININNNNNNS